MAIINITEWLKDYKTANGPDAVLDYEAFEKAFNHFFDSETCYLNRFDFEPLCEAYELLHHPREDLFEFLLCHWDDHDLSGLFYCNGETILDFVKYLLSLNINSDEVYSILFDTNELLIYADVHYLWHRFRNAPPTFWFLWENESKIDYDWFWPYMLGTDHILEVEGEWFDLFVLIVDYAVKHNLQLQFDYKDVKGIVVDPEAVITNGIDTFLACWSPKQDMAFRYKISELTHVKLCNTIRTHGMMPGKWKEDGYFAIQP